jgi:acyl-CoA hydrolase
MLAFEAVRRAVADGVLELVQQVFFGSPVKFADFAEFERMVIGATHTSHRLSAEQYERVRERFARHQTPQGATFTQPMRVDLLRKGAA